MYDVTFPGGVSVDVAIGGRTIHTDQPQDLGGTDSGPTPFQLFLASLATCAGFYALRFCQERNIATEGLRVTMEREPGLIRIAVVTPPEFPEKYRDAIARAVDHCAVKRTIAEPPRFEVRVS